MRSSLALRHLGPREYANVVALALRNVTASMKAPAKVLAQASNANTKSAENWLAGRTLPSAFHLDCIEEAFPELRGEIRRVRGIEALGEPIEREITELLNRAIQLRTQHVGAARAIRGVAVAKSGGPDETSG